MVLSIEPFARTPPAPIFGGSINPPPPPPTHEPMKDLTCLVVWVSTRTACPPMLGHAQRMRQGAGGGGWGAHSTRAAPRGHRAVRAQLLTLLSSADVARYETAFRHRVHCGGGGEGLRGRRGSRAQGP